MQVRGFRQQRCCKSEKCSECVVWFAKVVFGENVGRVCDTFEILNRDDASCFELLNERTLRAI